MGVTVPDCSVVKAQWTRPSLALKLGIDTAPCGLVSQRRPGIASLIRLIPSELTPVPNNLNKRRFPNCSNFWRQRSYNSMVLRMSNACNCLKHPICSKYPMRLRRGSFRDELTTSLRNNGMPIPLRQTQGRPQNQPIGPRQDRRRRRFSKISRGDVAVIAQYKFLNAGRIVDRQFSHISMRNSLICGIPLEEKTPPARGDRVNPKRRYLNDLQRRTVVYSHARHRNVRCVRVQTYVGTQFLQVGRPRKIGNPGGRHIRTKHDRKPRQVRQSAKYGQPLVRKLRRAVASHLGASLKLEIAKPREFLNDQRTQNLSGNSTGSATLVSPRTALAEFVQDRGSRSAHQQPTS